MLGADRVSRQVAGHRLDLYRRGDRFQVIRFGWLPRQERAGMERQMLAFAMVATGCRLYRYVNAVLIFPKSAEVKFPTTAVAAISRLQ